MIQNKKYSQEVKPPWIVYPGILPGDIFWRFGGEAYMQYAFLPYLQSLNEKEKAEYLKRWHVPEDWAFYFDPDPEVKDFLNDLDTE